MDNLIARLKARVAASADADDAYPIEPSPPASDADLAASEARLGFALPPLLKRIYREVANGGFGPGYGVLGIEDGFGDDLGATASSLYLMLSDTQPHDDPALRYLPWPSGWLPFCYWGCTVYSAVHCEPPYAVSFVDLGNYETDADDEGAEPPPLALPRASLTQWFEDWLDGKELWDESWQ